MAVPIYTPEESAALTAAFKAGAQFLFGSLPLDRETEAKVLAQAGALYPTTKPARVLTDVAGNKYRAQLPFDPATPRFEAFADGSWRPLDQSNVRLTLERYSILTLLTATPLEP